MRNLKLALTAGITALALAATPVATAQSSLPPFGSSSAAPSEESLTPEPDDKEAPQTPDTEPDDEASSPEPDTNEAWLKTLYDEAFEGAGFVADPASVEVAENLADRAVAGELTFVDNQVEVHGLNSMGLVVRLSQAELTVLIAAIDAGLVDPKDYLDSSFAGYEIVAPYGSAVTSDEEYVYYAFAIAV